VSQVVWKMSLRPAAPADLLEIRQVAVVGDPNVPTLVQYRKGWIFVLLFAEPAVEYRLCPIAMEPTERFAQNPVVR